VQVEYDLELYGAEKKVNLPFVMGVMADLSGKPEERCPGRRPQVPRDRRRQLRRAPEER
jgi:type VI secretion system ImpB/VipA family protein